MNNRSYKQISLAFRNDLLNWSIIHVHTLTRKNTKKEPVIIQRLKINTSTGETYNNDMFYTNITDYNRSPLYITYTNHEDRYSILPYITMGKEEEKKTYWHILLFFCNRSFFFLLLLFVNVSQYLLDNWRYAFRINNII